MASTLSMATEHPRVHRPLTVRRKGPTDRVRRRLPAKPQSVDRTRSWHWPFVHRVAGVRILDIPPSHLMQRRDAFPPVLLDVAHRPGLPGSAGTAESNPRFDDSEVPVTVVRIYAPCVESGRRGRQQNLMGELVDWVVNAFPAQPRRQPVPCCAV